MMVWNICVFSSLSFLEFLFASNKWFAAGVNYFLLYFSGMSSRTFDNSSVILVFTLPHVQYYNIIPKYL